MTIRSFHAALLMTALFLAMATGCSRKLEPEKPGAKHRSNDVVARVDHHKMVWSELEKRAQSYLKDELDSKTTVIPPGREDEALQFFRRKAVMLYINKTLMYNEAKRRGIQVTKEDREKSVKQIESLLKQRGVDSLEAFYKKSPLGEKETRREFEDGLIVDKLIDADVRAKISVSDADRDALVREIVTLRQNAKKKVEELRGRLLKGADLTSLLREASGPDSKSVSGGDLGEITRGRLADKALEDALFSQKINEVGPVMDNPRGYMVLRVSSHTAAKAATATTPAVPETVRASFILVRSPPAIKAKDMDNLIQQRKYQEGLKEMLKNLRAKAKIETIYPDLVF
jgi:parvulin-like peptidyl-prolyl isomerase